MTSETRNATAARKAALAIQREKAIALRLAGLSYVAIGQKLGISSTSAFRAVVHVLKESGKRRADAGDTILDGELERLDRLQAAGWVRALNGDPESIRACLAVLNQRAKLLGLEAPVKVEVSRKDLLRITQDMGRVVEAALSEIVADPETRDALALRIRDGWLAIEG